MKRASNPSMRSLSPNLENFKRRFLHLFENGRDKGVVVAYHTKSPEREDCNSLGSFSGLLRTLSYHKMTAGDLCSVVCSREGTTSKTPKFVGLFAQPPDTKRAGRCPADFCASSAGSRFHFGNLGGAKEGRTPDLLTAIQTLYQLSSSPMARLTAVESSKSPPASQAEKRGGLPVAHPGRRMVE